MTEMEQEPESPAEPRSWLAAAREEIAAHPMAYFVLLLFVIAGPVVTAYLFPQAPRGAGLLGGVAFGVYAALCAMPGRFL
jgi:hypothetical protein